MAILNLRLDWIRLLDQLKARLEQNDARLAAELGLSRSMLAQVRSGHRQLPTAAKFTLLDRLGYAMTRGAVLAALPNDLTEAITQADNNRAHERVSEKACFEFLEFEFDQLSSEARKKFFDLLCELGECNRKTLADLLQMKATELREVERGNVRLHFLAKAAIYECFDSVGLSEVIDAIEPVQPPPG